MPAPLFGNTDFTGAILRLLPRGRVWPKAPVFLDAVGTIDPDAPVQVKVMAALAPTYTRSGARAANLLVDAFPATTVELLPEWQSALGLPDPCVGASPLLSQEQGQVVARLTGRGKNQSVAFFINFAATLGYPITITQFAPFRAGRSAAGQPLCGSAWANAWQVNAPTFEVDYFAAGDAAGEPLATWGSTALQCELQRVAPAHTTLLFQYS